MKKLLQNIFSKIKLYPLTIPQRSVILITLIIASITVSLTNAQFFLLNIGTALGASLYFLISILHHEGGNTTKTWKTFDWFAFIFFSINFTIILIT